SGPDVGALIQPGVSCEEGQLLSRLMRGLGSPHIDHRLDVLDFADAPVVQAFELSAAKLQKVQAALLVGSDLRHEIPLVNHRLHQAAKNGARVYALNPAHFDANFNLTSEVVVAPQQLVDRLAALVRVASERDHAPQIGSELRDRVAAATPHDGDREWVEALARAEHAVIMLGHVAAQHPQASWLRALLRYLATVTGAAFDELPLGANDLGLARAGVLPGQDGLHARSMLTAPRQAYLLYNAELEDFADSRAALRALCSAELVVAFSAFANERLREVADVLLPIGLLPEVDATLVNLDGMVQQVASAARLPGAARPGWRVLRALGEQLKLPGFGFTQLEELLGELHPMLEQAVATGQGLAKFAWPTAGLVRLATRPIYRSDPVLRRCEALARHPLSRPAEVVMHADDLAALLGLQDGAAAQVDGVTLPVRADSRVPLGTAWIESHHPETLTLPEYGQVLTISKV
ncbi:MAG TPA: NADH-quinone oxidoreductase subunit G, partial [Mizugakiibacter sp.]|nr:NADH-quinone oxidoreductase subunit G [Mizugakiibacter sp.]